jgi:membrane-associated protease RseP (regulator of RpoE activity)
MKTEPTSELPPPEPPTPANPGTRYERLRSEMVAGGAVGESETVSGAQGLLFMAIIVGLLAWLGIANIWMLVFVLGILISVLLHEFGHFITAKWAGMKVTQFFMGFGPKLWSFRRGEVEYGVRALPLGAFVRIIGMSNIDEVEPADEGRTYRQKPYRWRMLVICAGSLMHFIITIALLLGVYSIAGRPEETGPLRFVAVETGAPAAAAGVEPGDVVLSVDGVAADSPEEVTDQIRSHAPGDTVSLVVQRDGVEQTLAVTLAAREDDASVGYLGVSSGYDVEYLRHGPLTTAGNIGRDTWDASYRSVKGVVTVVNPVNLFNHLTGQSDDLETRPTTLVGATNVSSRIGDFDGFKGILLMLAAVNLFFGLFNLFPLLPFDGGHAAIATYERIRSRPGKRYFADVTKMMPVALGVMTLLGFMLFTGLYLDIAKPL